MRCVQNLDLDLFENMVPQNVMVDDNFPIQVAFLRDLVHAYIDNMFGKQTGRKKEAYEDLHELIPTRFEMSKHGTCFGAAQDERSDIHLLFTFSCDFL